MFTSVSNVEGRFDLAILHHDRPRARGAQKHRGCQNKGVVSHAASCAGTQRQGFEESQSSREFVLESYLCGHKYTALALLVYILCAALNAASIAELSVNAVVVEVLMRSRAM